MAIDGQQAQRERVEQVDVLPFADIEDQINANYGEIQTKTTQAVVKRLGLGQGVLITEVVSTQTDGQFVERDRYNEIDLELYEAKNKITRLERECRKQSELLEVQELKMERIEEAQGKAKARIATAEAEAEAATHRVNNLEAEVEDM